MEDYEDFIEQRLKGDFLQVLRSRWAALLPSLVKVTQQLQLDTLEGSTDTIEEKFALAHTILDDEYTIYTTGITLALSKGDDCPPHFELLLRSLLTNLSMKESVLADWRAHLSSVSPDTLRVYSHSLLASSEGVRSQVERCLLLCKPSV
ncbi:hypothetical protein STCU_03175 [Strigomonas culicis]|uniref:Uncharacterized protein n=1 Tax=Strigomonas culicis TaxID=28005 RepID=S9W788_9TRYP|nr:hypothetical protein STCU_03175 [Strigomonas culicis]|eukprot:EPY31850.1 hypothetical protein STCU_03175 [Strigomonas culicis]